MLNKKIIFRALQIRARDGNSTIEDWNMLLSRKPQKVENINEFLESAVRLSFGNRKVTQDNFSKLSDLKVPIVEINAHHSHSKVKSFTSTAEEMGGLEPTLYVAKNARVMLTRNLWTEAGLCNGTMGTIKDIIFPENYGPTVLPIAIIVQYDNDYIGPSFCHNIPNC